MDEAERKLGIHGSWMQGWFNLGRELTETAGKVGSGKRY